jgi:hypothetical protein
MVGEGHKLAVYAYMRIVADLEMKVARFALGGYAQQIIDIHRPSLRKKYPETITLALRAQ